VPPKTKEGVEYFYIKARYLDFDGKVFGETSSGHAIEKFRGAKQITALEVFPLKYHPGERHMRAYLSENGRKFLSMMDIHLCEYEGKAFYIEKGRVVEISSKAESWSTRLIFEKRTRTIPDRASTNPMGAYHLAGSLSILTKLMKRGRPRPRPRAMERIRQKWRETTCSSAVQPFLGLA
jgi:hypothetical protein